MASFVAVQAAVCTGEIANHPGLEPLFEAVSSRLEGHLDGRSPAAVPAFRPLPVSDIDIGTSGSIAETSTHQQLQRGVADLAASLQHVAQQRADAAVAHTHASLELRVGRLESQLAEVRMAAGRDRAAAAAAESMSQQFGAQMAAMQRQIVSLQLQLGAADVGAAEDTTGERAELPEPGSGGGGVQEGC
ncbi:hypothetical protein ACK3TF_005340 [Chlorella vulgaris]